MSLLLKDDNGIENSHELLKFAEAVCFEIARLQGTLFLRYFENIGVGPIV